MMQLSMATDSPPRQRRSSEEGEPDEPSVGRVRSCADDGKDIGP